MQSSPEVKIPSRPGYVYLGQEFKIEALLTHTKGDPVLPEMVEDIWAPDNGPVVLPPPNYVFDADTLTIAITYGGENFSLRLETITRKNSGGSLSFFRDGKQFNPPWPLLFSPHEGGAGWRLRDAIEDAAWRVFFSRRYFRTDAEFDFWELLAAGYCFDWETGSFQLASETTAVRRSIPIFNVEPEGETADLIDDRYLCRHGSVLLSGPTGIGKSSLALQLAVAWALGLPCLGFKPSGPLATLIVQAENDAGDIAEMVEGVADGLELTEQDRQLANQFVSVYSAPEHTGPKFFAELERRVRDWQPDLLILDPLLAFVGADISKQDVAADFLRHRLAPLCRRGNMGVLILHHEGKPARDGRPGENLDYAGFGSSELANWARAIISLRREGDAFCLALGKRGKRAGIRDDQGELKVWLRHSPGRIFWEQVAGASVSSPNRAKTAADLLALVPEPPARILKNVLIEKAKTAGIGERKSRAFMEELTDAGKLQLHREKRPGTNPAQYFSRMADFAANTPDESKDEPF